MSEGGITERWVPSTSAVAAWGTYPSPYELALLDQWLQGLIGSDRDYEARLTLSVLAQRQSLAGELAARPHKCSGYCFRCDVERAIAALDQDARNLESDRPNPSFDQEGTR